MQTSGHRVAGLPHRLIRLRGAHLRGPNATPLTRALPHIASLVRGRCTELVRGPASAARRTRYRTCDEGAATDYEGTAT